MPAQKPPTAALNQDIRIYFLLLKVLFSKCSVLPLNLEYLSIVLDNWNKDFQLAINYVGVLISSGLPVIPIPYYIIGCLELDLLFLLQIQDQIFFASHLTTDDSCLSVKSTCSHKYHLICFSFRGPCLFKCDILWLCVSFREKHA